MYVFFCGAMTNSGKKTSGNDYLRKEQTADKTNSGKDQIWNSGKMLKERVYNFSLSKDIDYTEGCKGPGAANDRRQGGGARLEEKFRSLSFQDFLL